MKTCLASLKSMQMIINLAENLRFMEMFSPGTRVLGTRESEADSQLP